MNRTSASAAILLLLGPQASPTASAQPVQLGTTIVTATRTAQTVDQTLASVSVVTRADIERRQARSVGELLQGLPGVQVSSNGGLGKNTSVFLRGTDSDHVLVLVDGIQVGSATLGLTAFQDLPVAQIERIEVVRGPRSSLYGSEAIGGVIQIFTRRGSGAVRPFASIGAGTYETWEATAGVSGSVGRGHFSLSASGVDTEGFDACSGDPVTFAGCAADDPDDDGYRNLSGAFRGGYRFANGVEVSGHALHADTDNEFDGSFVDSSEGVQQVLGASLGFSPADAWRATLRAGRSRDELDSFKDGAFRTRFDTERDTVSLQNDVTLGTGRLLTVGADYQEDRVASNEDFAVASRETAGVFGQYQGTYGAQDVQAALRHDDNEQFGGETTGSAAWGYGLGNGVRLTVGYGTAFKAPTFNDLYFPGFGNPELDPERSRSLEVGLGGDPSWGSWSVAAYRTEIEDLIAFDSTTRAPANVADSRIHGFEGALVTEIRDWVLDVSLTLLDPENRTSGANEGNRLPRRAERSLRIDADRDFGRYSLGATLLAESRRYDDLANRRELGGYGTVDLRGEYRLAPAWTLQARITNLFDKEYETAAFFNQPGRSLFVTLRYAPGA